MSKRHTIIKEVGIRQDWHKSMLKQKPGGTDINDVIRKLKDKKYEKKNIYI